MLTSCWRVQQAKLSGFVDEIARYRSVGNSRSFSFFFFFSTSTIHIHGSCDYFVLRREDFYSTLRTEEPSHALAQQFFIPQTPRATQPRSLFCLTRAREEGGFLIGLTGLFLRYRTRKKTEIGGLSQEITEDEGMSSVRAGKRVHHLTIPVHSGPVFAEIRLHENEAIPGPRQRGRINHLLVRDH